MREDPDRAQRFTRMLYEIHLPLAAALAQQLDLAGTSSIMDIGGGSGIISMALVERWPALRATVVDIPSVCAAGRAIARERKLQKRLAYHPADFLHAELPGGFDVVLECDVGAYDEDLFAKIRRSLQPGGRLVIVHDLCASRTAPTAGRLRWALERSMADAHFAPPTPRAVAAQLRQAGFRIASRRPLLGHSMGILEAERL
jgi:SAM-dependent methyltransferase